MKCTPTCSGHSRKFENINQQRNGRKGTDRIVLYTKTRKRVKGIKRIRRGGKGSKGIRSK